MDSEPRGEVSTKVGFRPSVMEERRGCRWALDVLVCSNGLRWGCGQEGTGADRGFLALCAGNQERKATCMGQGEILGSMEMDFDSGGHGRTRNCHG
jgi:hypothetical protein